MYAGTSGEPVPWFGKGSSASPAHCNFWGGCSLFFIELIGVTLVNKWYRLRCTIPQHILCTHVCAPSTPRHVWSIIVYSKPGAQAGTRGQCPDVASAQHQAPGDRRPRVAHSDPKRKPVRMYLLVTFCVKWGWWWTRLETHKLQLHFTLNNFSHVQATGGFGRIALSSYTIHYNYVIKCGTGFFL